MAITNFTASIWAKEVLRALRKSLVYGSVVNTDYEGEIKGKGSTVKINSISDVTIGSYVKGTPITLQELTDAQRSLTVDQQKYFAFEVDDIDQAQTESDIMAAAMESGAFGLKNAADAYIASLYTGVDAGNVIGDDTTPKVPTAADAVDYIIDLGTLLDEDDVPEEGRWAVVPPWYYAMLLKSDYFQPISSPTAESVLANGKVGTIDAFTIFKSNNVPNTTGTKYKIMAGYKGALSFAAQVNKVEAYRPEDSFSDAVKGLYTYGAKVVQPKGFAVLTANKA